MKLNHPFQDGKDTKRKDKLVYCHWSWNLVGRTKSKPFTFCRLRIFCCFQLVKYDSSRLKSAVVTPKCKDSEGILTKKAQNTSETCIKNFFSVFFLLLKVWKVKFTPLTPHWRTHITKRITKSKHRIFLDYQIPEWIFLWKVPFHLYPTKIWHGINWGKPSELSVIPTDLSLPASAASCSGDSDAPKFFWSSTSLNSEMEQNSPL